MKTGLLVALAIVVFGASGCDSYGKTGSVSPSPSLNPATAMIDTDDGVVLVKTEVADSPEERAVGLMNRESIGEDEGMMFLFFEENEGGFWMKDTLIPLSIAFFDRDGTILSILDMEPCRRDSCKSYDPGVPYWGALEVNQGAYEEWGVEVGDRVRSNQ